MTVLSHDEADWSEEPARPEYHGHANYIVTWAVLVVLLGVSLAFSLVSKALAIFLIFSVAIVKAMLVAGNFMHLRWEPRVLWAIAAIGLVCALCFYFGVYPDIVPIHRELAP
jgi:caa(3)-type oxidase subunit IV